MAEQTAALHRQFLEGQEKTQQIFLKLLDQEQRVSIALLDSPAPPAKSLAPNAETNGREHLSSRIATPARQSAPELPGGAHSNGKASLHATDHPSAHHRPIEGTISDTLAIESVAATLIEVVADKTGYPAGVLDLDMQLDADLGIDSIKRVEILSALQDRLEGLPVLQPEQLGSFRTLRAIVDFLGQSLLDGDQAVTSPAVLHWATTPNRQRDRRLWWRSSPTRQATPPTCSSSTCARYRSGYRLDQACRDLFRHPGKTPRHPRRRARADRDPRYPARDRDFRGSAQRAAGGESRRVKRLLPSEAGSSGLVEQILLEAVADKTGYPIDMLELDMLLDTDLGIDSIKRVEILSAVQEPFPAPA